MGSPHSADVNPNGFYYKAWPDHLVTFSFTRPASRALSHLHLSQPPNLTNMRVTTLLAFAFAAIATASAILPRSAIDNFPTCAHSCLDETNHHGCKKGDDQCLCKNSA
ncbi:hypothetical protein FRB96_000560, partial [Tulasnella sp. 330]